MATRNSTTHNYKDGRLLFLAFHNLHGQHQNNWKKKEKETFLLVVISNTLKVISVLRKKYSTLIVNVRKKMIKECQNKSIYTRNQP